MEDSEKKEELHPIRTLRLNPPIHVSPERQQRDRLRSNYTTDSGKLSYFDLDSHSRSHPLSTVLNRAQHAKRESILHPIGAREHILESPALSQKSISKKSSVMDNEKPENFSPKKSVFGEYHKIQEPFGQSDCDKLSKSSNSGLNQKGSEHNFFEEKRGFEPNFFSHQINEAGQHLPALHRRSLIIDPRNRKRFSIDFIEGGGHLNLEEDFINNISTFQTNLDLDLDPGKKAKRTRKKRTVSAHTKTGGANLAEQETKAVDGSEDKTTATNNYRRRYATNGRSYERSQRFKNKVRKLHRYWKESNVGIPQPFRLINGKERSKTDVLEFIDLSLKEVLCNAVLNLQCRTAEGRARRASSGPRAGSGRRMFGSRRGPLARRRRRARN